jgi:hypothetical protein
MEAKELRIGNLFRFISTNSIEYVSDIKTNGLKTPVINNVSIKDTEPIPLTEEWLVKFGFVKDKLEVGLYHFNDLEIFLPNYFTWKTQFINNIKHVHQLQNLYFALTNEELTIK